MSKRSLEKSFYVWFPDVGRRITKKKELLLLAQPTAVEAKVDRSGCSTELENKAQAQAGNETREIFGMELAEEQLMVEEEIAKDASLEHAEEEAAKQPIRLPSMVANWLPSVAEADSKQSQI